MCPYSSLDKSTVPTLMDDGLYRKILEELRKTGTVRNIILMLQNEPLLDSKFADRVRIARDMLGGVQIGTVTNGAPLTAANIKMLVSSGIDFVSVSIDAIREETFARIRQGLNFRNVVNNALSLSKQMGTGRVSVRFLRQRDNDGEEEAFRKFWSSHRIRPVFMQLTNRAGSMQAYERIKTHRPRLWKKLIYPVLNRCVPACPFPFSRITVLSDGRVVLCCHDWEPHDTVGDLSSQTLAEIWNGEKINHYRQLLWTGQAAESLVCADCSLSGPHWKI
jgi:radical SAM protein with 4Fe4S-binding SPASM domain